MRGRYRQDNLRGIRAVLRWGALCLLGWFLLFLALVAAL